MGCPSSARHAARRASARPRSRAIAVLLLVSAAALDAAGAGDHATRWRLVASSDAVAYVTTGASGAGHELGFAKSPLDCRAETLRLTWRGRDRRLARFRGRAVEFAVRLPGGTWRFVAPAAVRRRGGGLDLELEHAFWRYSLAAELRSAPRVTVEIAGPPELLPLLAGRSDAFVTAGLAAHERRAERACRAMPHAVPARRETADRLARAAGAPRPSAPAAGGASQGA